MERYGPEAIEVSRRRLSAAGLDAAASHQDRADAEVHGAALRSQRDVPADLHRRTAAAEGSQSHVERLLDRALGRGHARGANRGFPRQFVDRHDRQPDERRREDDGTDAPKNYGTLEIELTIDDPKTYTRPFTINLVQNLELDTELVDEFCLENEKSYERMLRSRGK